MKGSGYSESAPAILAQAESNFRKFLPSLHSLPSASAWRWVPLQAVGLVLPYSASTFHCVLVPYFTRRSCVGQVRFHHNPSLPPLIRAPAHSRHYRATLAVIGSGLHEKTSTYHESRRFENKNSLFRAASPPRTSSCSRRFPKLKHIEPTEKGKFQDYNAAPQGHP